jgi:hypothetical protein
LRRARTDAPPQRRNEMLLAPLATALSLTGGIAGTALIDPAFPVCSIQRPCVAPDPNDTIVFWRGSTRIAKATTAADGTFRVTLPAGLYTLTLPRRSRAGVTVAPASLRVTRGRFLRIVVRVDIGIR